MLNIGKLASGGAEYYLETVASGMEDYYTGNGEAPGYWTATGSAAINLSGRVEPETLRAVLGGLNPATGKPLGSRKSSRSVPGFDLTFRAPKSVSLLWGLGGPEIADQVRHAHDAAVAAGMAYLQHHAAYSRRGIAGRQQVQGHGFVAAGFRHRTSRAADPLLHTHVLVANSIQAVDDGKWRTLDARHLYIHGKTAGYLYQAQLRYELTRRLGVSWDEVHNGCADVTGIDRDIIDVFSQRRADIEAAMAKRGTTSARSAQAATLDTRTPKDHTIDGATLTAEWTTRASALGLNPDDLRRLIDRQTLQEVTPDDVATLVDQLADRNGLTKHHATFTRRDVVQALAEHLGGRLDADTIDTLADLITEANDTFIPLQPHIPGSFRRAVHTIIRRPNGRTAAREDGERRYTTPEMLNAERRLLNAAVDSIGQHDDIVPTEVTDAAIASRPTISPEQADMVRKLTSDKDGVAVVVGKAGAGKTYALAAAREAWESSGHRVIGAALAARAAIELRDGARIDSTTIATLWRRSQIGDDRAHLDPRTVLVIDEAGMVDTRTLATLVDHATRAGAKVVLVGDHRQLPEIEAGGFRGLVDRLPTIQLQHNRRQTHPWEREALDELADGSPAPAIHTYRKHDRVTVGTSAAETRQAMVNDSWDHTTTVSNAGHVLMLAHRGDDVADLNRRARTKLIDAAAINGPAITDEAGRNFAAGDRVMFLRNRDLQPAGTTRRRKVANGDRGTVTATDLITQALTVQLDGGPQVTVPSNYLKVGHLDYGYATTGHKSQGATVDHAFVLHSDTFYRELAYVTMSCARHATRLYHTPGHEPDPELDQHGHRRGTAEEMVNTLEKRRARIMATEYAQLPLRKPTAWIVRGSRCGQTLISSSIELAEM